MPIHPGLLAPSSSINTTPEYSFQLIADDDPNLAQAGFRIEIEKRLQSLAESRKISVKRQSIWGLMRTLSKEGILTHSGGACSHGWIP